MPTIDPTYIKSPFISPNDFLERMKAIESQSPEYFHINADELMCDLLRSLGYGDAVDVFKNHERWYS